MTKYISDYLAVFLSMFLVDMLWLRVIAESWYQEGMGELLSESPNLLAAAAFYLLFPVGLVLFAVLPGAAQTSLFKAVGMGALFGFFAYATYDLTNLAVVKNWPLGLSILDMAWGTVASGIASAAGKLSLDYMNR